MAHALSGTIAHEVRKPVAQSRQSLEMIRMGLARLDRLRAAGDEAGYRAQIEEIGRIVDTGFSALSRGDMLISIILRNIREERIDPAGFEVLSAADVVHKAIAAYAFARGQRECVSLDLAADFRLRGDENLLIYVIFNLLQNALIYTASRPDLKVHIALVRENGRRCISVADNGPGIPPERLQSIFESFVTFAGKQGTGLGLPFCKRAVDAMGGTVEVRSEPGLGTELRLCFPPVAAQTAGEGADPPAGQAAGGRSAGAPGRP